MLDGDDIPECLAIMPDDASESRQLTLSPIATGVEHSAMAVTPIAVAIDRSTEKVVWAVRRDIDRRRVSIIRR